jgi:hypothetical protein
MARLKSTLCAHATAGSQVIAALIMVLTLAVPMQASGATISVNGVTFSDELGGFVLERASGQGSMDDPFVVVERMTGLAGGTLEFQIDQDFGNRIGSQHPWGFALIKVIENATDLPWESFELELQSKLGVPSDYWDGLSFGQGSQAGRPFTAQGFSRVTIVDEPYDRVEFAGGKIPRGGQATLRIVITESNLLAKGYLAQRPIRPVAEKSSPLTGHSEHYYRTQTVLRGQAACYQQRTEAGLPTTERDDVRSCLLINDRGLFPITNMTLSERKGSRPFPWISRPSPASTAQLWQGRAEHDPPQLPNQNVTSRALTPRPLTSRLSAP